MNRTYLLFILIIFCYSFISTGNTDNLWNKVNQAKRDGLPRTAIEYLEKIIEISERDNLEIDWLKANTEIIVLNSNIQGNKPIEKIIPMKAQIQKAEKPLDTMLRIVLARWYWHYYTQNRWRIMRRTRTSDMDNDDIETWDLPKIYSEIDALYKDILKDKDFLIDTPINRFIGFLKEGNTDIALRPSLYDFVAWEAINFYSYPEFNVSLPVGAYSISADSDAFSPYTDFINYQPDTENIDSPVYKSIRLYQSLIKKHIKNDNIPALLDTDINRLVYVKNHAHGVDIDDIFIQRLKELIEVFKAESLASKAYYHIARTYYQQEELVKAVHYAKIGNEQYKGTYSAHNCNVLINNIRHKALNITSESSIAEGESKVLVRYKNFEKLYIKIYERDWSEIFEERSPSPFNIDRHSLPPVISGNPVHEYEVELPRTEDYRMNTMEIDLPSLKKGFYWVIASYDENFGNTQHLQAAPVFVCNLAILNRIQSNKADGFIVDAEKGTPVAGVEVSAYTLNRERIFEKIHSTVTDNKGYYTLENIVMHRNFYIFIEKGNDKLLGQSQRLFSHSPPQRSQRTIFYTDRAIYRPGQTIYFKGICIDIDGDNKSYKTIPNHPVRVTFYDPNGKQIHYLSLRTNDFGSFSGNFTAPTDRLLGAMRISTHNPSGQTTVRVEEYKRPRFYTEFEELEEAYTINEEITVTGLALAYNGSPVDNAQVRYRVVREPQFPFWWSHFYPGRSSSTQEISNGATETDPLGRYHISFIASPDPKTQYDPNIFYRYTIHADVTDMAGETRSSSTTVNIGTRSINLGLSTEGNIIEDKTFQLKVSSRTLNGRLFPSEGRIKIYRLSEPDEPIPADLWQNPKDERKWTSNWKTWPTERLVREISFQTGDEGISSHEIRLPAGLYKIEALGKDTNDRDITALLPLMVSPGADRRTFPIKLPHYTAQPSSSARVGERYRMYWGTGYEEGQAYIEIITYDGILKSYWTPRGRAYHEISLDITEEMRGGFWITVFFVRENRNYTQSFFINVPWDNKNIDISFETFRDTLQPGEHETWKLNLKARTGKLTEAEMVATLYDSSLDTFVKHSFPQFNFFRTFFPSSTIRFSNSSQNFRVLINNWNRYMSERSYTYTSLPDHIIRQFWYYEMLYHRSGTPMPSVSPAHDDMADGLVLAEADSAESAPKESMEDSEEPIKGDDTDYSDITDDVSIRTDLRETSFFYPHLIMNDDGSITIDFQIGESLTKWRFLGFAHNNQCMSGSIENFVTTKKDIMIQPNPPRFLRENDKLIFPATIINTTEEIQRGKASIELLDFITNDCILEDILEDPKEQDFVLKPNSSMVITWKLNIPKNCPPIEYTVIAAAQKHSDGEKGVIPVLPSRIFITESIPIHIREKETKEFTQKTLAELSKRDTLEPYSLIVEMSSNPIWYAIQALPYLIEYPYQCSEQVFNRIYANYISRYILHSDPEIKRIMDIWKTQPDSLKSNLEKNQELKSVMLEETPWLTQAKNESEAKRNLALYFDENHIADLHRRSMNQLKNMQMANGAFPWFPGGRENAFITLYIIAGFGKLEAVGMELDDSMISGAIAYGDNWLKDVYERIRNRDSNNLSSIIALYLYARSFFADNYPIPSDIQEAFDYFTHQAEQYWLSLNSRMNQGQIALALHRLNDKETPAKIMASIKERSVYDHELGMFWREDELSLWWYRAPIETQALMIEAFDEIMQDKESVENCKIWLLKQKQTTHWRTTKATADAVYALIFIGEDWLQSKEITKVALGPRNITPKTAEAGTGYYKVIIPKEEIKEHYSRIIVQREEKGISWGGVHFQYFEDISAVKSHKTNLIVEKDLFIESYTDRGIEISPLVIPINPGDTVVVRITIKTDRDMEYVHLKDYRGSGFEPLDVLSMYRYQDGLIYYQTTRDTATHFFIDYLPKGTYIFEYKLKTQHRGSYQSGIAEISCMYAPEFQSHSESMLIEVE